MKTSEYVLGIPAPTLNNFNTKERNKMFVRFNGHSQAPTHILACSPRWREQNDAPEEQISVPEIDENGEIKMERTDDEIEVKVEMHDSDDEPLNKIMRLSDDVIDIACKEENVKTEIYCHTVTVQ